MVEQIIKPGTVYAEGIATAGDPDSFQASPFPFCGGNVKDNVFGHDAVGCLSGGPDYNITTPGGDAESMELPVSLRGQAVAIHFMFVIPHYPLVVLAVGMINVSR